MEIVQHLRTVLREDNQKTSNCSQKVPKIAVVLASVVHKLMKFRINPSWCSHTFTPPSILYMKLLSNCFLKMNLNLRFPEIPSSGIRNCKYNVWFEKWIWHQFCENWSMNLRYSFVDGYWCQDWSIRSDFFNSRIIQMI